MSFVIKGVPVRLGRRCSRIGSCLHFNSVSYGSIAVKSGGCSPVLVAVASAAFTHFFRCRMLRNGLRSTLTSPSGTTLDRSYTQGLFKGAGPMKGVIRVSLTSKNVHCRSRAAPLSHPFRVTTMLGRRSRSCLGFSVLANVKRSCCNKKITLLGISPSFSGRRFTRGVGTSKIPALRRRGKQCCFCALRRSCFRRCARRSVPCVTHSRRSLLLVKLVSTLLVLLVTYSGCVGLDFSQVLRRVQVVRARGLVKTARTRVGCRLFLSAFLAINVTFLLSLLVTRSLVPIFGQVVSKEVAAKFFLGERILPIVYKLVLVLSIVPTYCVDQGVTGLASDGCHVFFAKGGGEGIIATLSIVRCVVSVKLIVKALAVRTRLGLARGGNRYCHGLVRVKD